MSNDGPTVDDILAEAPKPVLPPMPDQYTGMADKDRLRKLADAIESLWNGAEPSADVTMLRLVAQRLEDAEEKPPLPAKWGTVQRGSICLSMKRRFMEVIGEERLKEMAISDHRILAIERKIRELEESVSGNDGIVAKAWREASAARKAYMDAHQRREQTWRRIALLRSDQRLRLEKLMRDELSARIEKIRIATNHTMIKAPPSSKRKWDRRGKTRIQIIPRDMELPLKSGDNDGGCTADGEATSQ